ncbi:MAG: cobalamin B12-binding domain-containing protein [Fimbriimonadaceae bacterium]|nr:cobalamin B12-binding domain-containing protein [Alphaproteobacteria bacterium]
MSENESRKIKVLLAKPGLDGHDVGAKVVVRALMEAGMEVVYTGLRKSPQEIAEAARDINADVIGLSILSGSHMPICTELKEELNKWQLSNKVWVIGGNIPEEDHQKLKDMGLDGVFNTGSNLDEIVRFIKEKAVERAA